MSVLVLVLLGLVLPAAGAAPASAKKRRAGEEEAPALVSQEAAPDPAAPDPGAAPAAPEGLTEPVTVSVGAYVARVSNVNLKEGTYIADFWAWFRWRGGGEGFDPADTFEVISGAILSREGSEKRTLPDGSQCSAVRVVAQLSHVFDVRDFPLDDHTLHIEIEDTNYEKSELE